MKKIVFYYGMLLPFIFMVLSCREEDFEKGPIQIVTNKNHFSTNENIVIEISNLSDSVAWYSICSSYKGIPPLVYKLKNNSWTGYWSPICNGYASYCCAELSAGDTFKDTLAIVFEPGYYRVEYSFIIRPGNVYKSYYSNEFKIK